MRAAQPHSPLLRPQGGAVFTPASHLLEGITRGRVLGLAAAAGMPVHVQRCSLDDFQGADEVFTTGTTKRVAPVAVIDGRHLPGGGAPGPVTRALYRLLVEAEAAEGLQGRMR